MQYLNLLCAKLPTAVWIGVPGVNSRLSQIPLQAQVQFYNWMERIRAKICLRVWGSTSVQFLYYIE